VFALSKKQSKGSVKTTYIYKENGEDIENLLSESFALFVEKEATESYNEANGWLLIGGTICTQK